MNELPVSLTARIAAAGETAYASGIPLEAKRQLLPAGRRATCWMAALAFLSLLGIASAWAQDSSGTQNGVSFVSGGVGADSQERLQALEKDFDLKLVFTLIEGNYVSDVGVTVKDASGKAMIEHVTSGPFFMAKLPAGTYNVTATYKGQSQTRKVSVRSNRLRTDYLRWKSDPNVDFIPLPDNGKE
jgi:hypothetical protein